MRQLKQKVYDGLSEMSWQTLREVTINSGTHELADVHTILEELIEDGLATSKAQPLTQEEIAEKRKTGLFLSETSIRYVYCRA